jgi:HEAT repeat protein
LTAKLTESLQYDLFFELARNLSDPSRELRMSTVRAISKVANRRCTNLLMDKLELEKDVFIKASLIKVLGDIGTPNLISALDKYLHHPEPRIRSNAIESLARLRLDDHVQLLERIFPCVRDENNRVAATALKESLVLGHEACLPLLKLMLKGTDPARKSSAIWVVGELVLESCMEDVLYAMYSSHYGVHRMAVRSLSRFGHRVIPELFSNLDMDDVLVTVYTLLYFENYLESISPEQTEVLLGLCSHERMDICCLALRVLLKLKVEGGFKLLEANLFSDSDRLRSEAVQGLSKYMDHADSSALLLRACSSESDPKILASLINCFANCPSEESISKLKELLSHSDERVCANAVEVLGRIGDLRLVDALRPCLESSSNRIMANAAIALFRLGEERVVSHLRNALSLESSIFRASAAYALGEIGSEPVVEALVGQLLDDSERVRNQVLIGLMKQNIDVLSRLISFLKENSSRNSRKVLTELIGYASKEKEGGSRNEKLLEIYAQKVSSFELPEFLEEGEIDSLMTLLFGKDHQLRIYSIYVLGEKRVKAVESRLICLLYDSNHEIVGESLLALDKLGAKNSLVFLRELYPALKGENIRLCANTMRKFSKGELDPSYFESPLSKEHKEALEK